MADVCFQFGPFHRQYGVATSSAGLNSHLQAGIPSTTNANLYTGALAAGDVKVSKDGGAEANIGTLPVQIAATGVWVFALSNTELACATLTIHVKKAGSTAEIVLTVETNLAIGRLSVVPTALGGNVSGISAVGVGTGHGFDGTGGASGDGFRGTAGGGSTTVGIRGYAGTSNGAAGIYGDASASILAGGGQGIYAAGGNGGRGILAAGQGAGAGIEGYAGATGVGFRGVGGSTSGDCFYGVTTGTGRVCNFFDTLEGAEPAGAIANNASFAQILQYEKRRFLNKVTQTITVQTIYKDNSTDPLTTMAVSDDGTTQSKGKSS